MAKRKLPKLRKKHTRIKDLSSNKKGAIQDLLSSTFTVDFDDGTFRWFFYKDYQVEWETIDE